MNTNHGLSDFYIFYNSFRYLEVFMNHVYLLIYIFKMHSQESIRL